MDALMTAIVLAAAVAAVACTLTLAKISRPIRTWIAYQDGAAWRWLGDLMSCPYCVAHWLAFGATALYRPRLVELWWPLDLLVTAFAIVAAATTFVLVIRRTLLPVKIQLDTPPVQPVSFDDLAKLTGGNGARNGR